eukprot:4299784-Pleurochrysis_carterae.AAC.1
MHAREGTENRTVATGATQRHHLLSYGHTDLAHDGTLGADRRRQPHAQSAGRARRDSMVLARTVGCARFARAARSALRGEGVLRVPVGC